MFARLWEGNPEAKQGGIKKGNPRAVEVGIKVMERRANMLGLDAAAQDSRGSGMQVIINYHADPRDEEAGRFLAGLVQQGVLPSPIEGTLLPEESDSSDRGDGVGEDVVRTTFRNEET
jgi:hypothetical protein